MAANPAETVVVKVVQLNFFHNDNREKDYKRKKDKPEIDSVSCPFNLRAESPLKISASGATARAAELI